MTKPPGWTEARLDEVAQVRLGRQRSPDKAHGNNLVPYLRAANVRWGGLDLSDVKSMQFEPAEVETFRLRRDDILVVEASGSRDEVGKSALWREELPLVCLQNTLIRVRPRDAVDPEFLRWHLHNDASTGDLGGASKGIGIHHIGGGRLASWMVNIPPLNEQRRIVAKLGAIVEQTRVVKARLERLPTLLDKLKRSILAAAFRGDLTADWRASHPAGEPASAVLDRIRADRRRRWEEAIRAKGKDPSKGKYNDHIEIDADDLPELPPNWSWASLGTLSWDSGYGTSEKCDYEGVGEYVLRIPNVASGDIDVSDLKRSLTGLGLKRDELIAAGDFMIVRTNGSRDLIGRAACALDTDPAIGHYFASYLIRFRLANPMVGRWLSLWWRSPFMRRWLELHAASSAGQYNVSLSTLATAPIPLANADEIGRIVDLVEQGLDAAHTLSERIERGAISTSDLERAALAKAFRGELVAQDPNDEPAAALIERIRAVVDTRTENGAAKPRGRVARAKSQGRTALAETES